MKKIIIKLFEPALLILLIAGVLATVVINYFNYLQFTGVSLVSLFIGSLIILLQISGLVLFSGLLFLGADALKRFLGDKEEA